MTMFKLALYEFKKISSSRLLIGLSVLLLLIALFLCNRTIQSTQEQKCLNDLVSAYQENPEEILEYRQKIKAYARTPEADIPRLYSGSSAYNDYTLFEDFNDLLEAKEIYRQSLEPVIRSLSYQEAEIAATSGEDSYAARRVARMIRLYEEKYEETVFPVETSRGWDVLFSFDLVNILILSVTVLGASLLFTSDGPGHLSYVGITCLGKRTRMMSKMLAASVYALAVPVVFILAISLLIGIRTGFSSWNMPLAAFEQFKFEPYGFSVGWFFICFLAAKCAGSLFAAVLTGCVSLFVKRPGAVFVSGMIVPGIGCLVYLAGGHHLNLYGWMHFSPLVERYYSFNSFGQLWDLPAFACGTIMFLIFALSVAYGALSKRFAVFAPADIFVTRLRDIIWRLRNRFKSKDRAPVEVRNLFSGELFKTIVASRLLPAVLILLTVSIYVSSLSYTKSESIEETMVKNYILSIQKLDEGQKADFILSERLRIDSAMENEKSMNLKFKAGEISSLEYSAFLDELNYARKHDVAFGKVEAQWDYVLSRRNMGYRAELIYDADWMRYFGSEINLPSIFLVILLGVSLFAQEYGSRRDRNGWIFILRSTPSGRRRLFCTKLTVSLCIGFLMFLLVTGADLFFAFRNLELSDFSSGVASVKQFSNIRLDISLGWFCVLRYAVRLFGFLVVSALSCLSGLWLKHHVYASFVAGAVLLVPYLADKAGFWPSRFTELVLILNGTTGIVWLGDLSGDRLPFLMIALLFGWIIFVTILSLLSSRSYTTTRSSILMPRRKTNGPSALESR